jgi:hypothetical protein
LLQNAVIFFNLAGGFGFGYALPSRVAAANRLNPKVTAEAVLPARATRAPDNFKFSETPFGLFVVLGHQKSWCWCYPALSDSCTFTL